MTYLLGTIPILADTLKDSIVNAVSSNNIVGAVQVLFGLGTLISIAVNVFGGSRDGAHHQMVINSAIGCGVAVVGITAIQNLTGLK